MIVKLFVRWFNRNFSDPQAVVLFFLLIAGFTVVLALGELLLPFFIAVVIAYLLDWGVESCVRLQLSRGVAASVVFTVFLAILLIILFILLPLVGSQTSNFFKEITAIVTKGQNALLLLPQKYPDLFSQDQIQKISNMISTEITTYSKTVVSASLSSLVGLVTILVYTILVPLLIFFLLKDKEKILAWFIGFLPKERNLASKVWEEVNEQIGNYVRGKVLEIFVVGAFTYIAFAFFGLEYALLLSVLVGLSVLIPFVGATVVTIPIALVAYYQWGFTSTFAWVMIVYGIIQVLDGNVLVPILFSEAVNLHPVAIIVSVLFFGGLWGVWGIFFAIPLATLVKAVMGAWEDVKKVE